MVAGSATPIRWTSRLPRWLSAVLGIACIGLGVFLALRPFASLQVLVLAVGAGLILHGIAELSRGTDGDERRGSRVLGVGPIVLGIAVLVWPGMTIRVMLVIVSGWLLVTGGVRILGTLRGDTDGRLASFLLGLASVILGVLALLWPDLSVLVVAVVFGLWLVATGISGVVDAIRGERPANAAQAAPRPAGLVRRFLRTTGAVVAVVVVLALAGLSATLHAGEPSPDAFYVTPGEVPDHPGVLLRSEPFTRGVPDGARAWRILYTTTRTEGVPAVASGLVVASSAPPATPEPVIAWAHGTTGVVPGCAISLLPHPFDGEAIPAVPQVLDRGWVMVATDYVGLGTEGPHPYLVGQGEARSVLDAVRAARQLPGSSLSDETVVWGHSQGGHAALWTGIVQPEYAPDVPLAGVAAMAPASDLSALVTKLDEVTGGPVLASYAVEGYTSAYPDVRFDDVVRPEAAIQVREMASRCLSEPEVLVSVVQSLLFDRAVLRPDALEGAMGARVAENVPVGPIDAPVLVAQGLADTIVLPGPQQGWVDRRCVSGEPVDYRTYDGVGHTAIVSEGSASIADLLEWTQDRLDGLPPTPSCG